MITERVGNLLTEFDLTHIAHQANLYHTFGAGLAAQIAEKWPRAQDADQTTTCGDRAKLGSYTVSTAWEWDEPAVVNLYSQDGMGPGSTDYDALRRALVALEVDLRALLKHGHAVRLGLPHGLGCGLAGGSWPKVYGLVESIFGRSPVEVVIVRLPEAA